MSRILIRPSVILTTAALICVGAISDVAETDENRPFRMSGKVLDPEGKPAVAQVRLVSVRGNEIASTESDEQGRFRLVFRPAEIDRPLGRDWGDATLLAAAEGYGPAWIRAGELRRSPETTLKLVRDDASVRAQIVDSDGRPVENAEITIHSLMRPDEGNLDPYLKEQRDEPGRYRYEADHMIYLSPKALELTLVKGSRGQIVNPDGETVEVFYCDDEGRLELRGIGTERKLHLGIRGRGIVSQSIHVLTRERIDPKWKRTKLSRNTRLHLESGGSLPIVYGAKFTHVGGASRPVVGTVRAKGSGGPLANVGVSAQMKGQNGMGYARTDEQGRYEIQGLPTSGVVSLYTICPKGMPYLNAKRGRMEFSAAAPLTNTDFELVRGVLVAGRLLDPEGNPAQGRVEYLALRSNEHAQRMPDPLGPYGGYITEEDGKFQVVAMPGLGLLVAKTYNDRFIPATRDDSIPTAKNGSVNTINAGLTRARYYDVFKPLDVSVDSEPLTVDLHLKSGDAIRGKLIDMKGRPVHRVEARGITPDGYRKSLDSNNFVVAGLRPGEKRRLIFRHDAKRLGSVFDVDASSPREITVTMRPYATLTGRIVDANGRPIPQALFVLMSAGAADAIEMQRLGKTATRPLEFAQGKTNADGRFRISSAISGCKSELLAGPPDVLETRDPPRLMKTLSLRSGETRDLGDLVLSAEDE